MNEGILTTFTVSDSAWYDPTHSVHSWITLDRTSLDVRCDYCGGKEGALGRLCPNSPVVVRAQNIKILLNRFV